MHREEKIKSPSPRATADPFCFRLGRFSQAFPSRALHVPVAAQASSSLVPDPTPCLTCSCCNPVPEPVPSVSPVPEVAAWSCSLCPIKGSRVPKQGTALSACPHSVPCAGSSSSLQGHPGALPLWPSLPTLHLSTGTVAQPPLICSFICSLSKGMKRAGGVIKQQVMLCCCALHFPW